MKEKLLFLALLSFAAASSFGQSIDQEVINSAGNHFTNTNQVTVSVGETVIGHFRTDDNHVSAGFIQPFSLEVELVNGIAEEQFASVEVFPNPTTKYLNIKISSKEASSIVTGLVYNQIGIAVHEVTLTHDAQTKQVDFSELPSGIYTLVLSNSRRKSAYKIIKK